MGWPRPEPQAPKSAQSQHVFAASGVRELDKNASLKRRDPLNADSKEKR